MEDEVPQNTLLSLNNIEVIYGDAVLVLKGVSLAVGEGRIVTLLGGNGAGKTTTLKSVSGLLKGEEGRVSQGSITFAGERIDRLPAEEIVRRGVFQVMEGRRVFRDLTTHENLVAGAHTRRNWAEAKQDMDKVFHYFPRLVDRRHMLAGFLSGGEQQMLAIGRALMARPRLMLLDEPSLGLAPLLVREIFEIIQTINREQKTTILLVEQNAHMALSIADHGYIMENGKVVMDDTVEKLAGNEDVKEFYLGLSKAGAQKSYRDVKHYRRRKRWLS